MQIVFELTISVVSFAAGIAFLWLSSKASVQTFAGYATKDYVFGSFICVGAGIYTLSAGFLLGNATDNAVRILAFQQFGVSGILIMITAIVHLLTAYSENYRLAYIVDTVCFILFASCIFDFHFYKDDLKTYRFDVGVSQFTTTLHKPDVGYMFIFPIVITIIIYSSYVFGVAHFQKQQRHVRFIFVGTILMAVLGLHDVCWATELIKNPLFPMFELGILAFIIGLTIKLVNDFLDAVSMHKSHIERLQSVIDKFFDPAVAGDGEDGFIKKFNSILKQKIHDPALTVEQLAMSMNMTGKTLWRRLKELTGQHPTDYLLKKRLEVAAHLLENTEDSVTQIAYSVGFKYPSHFSKSFKKHFMIEPSRYRQKVFT